MILGCAFSLNTSWQLLLNVVMLLMLVIQVYIKIRLLVNKRYGGKQVPPQKERRFAIYIFDFLLLLSLPRQ